MASVTRPHTWVLNEQPTAANANSDFDTLYTAITAGGQVSHVDGSQAFSTLDILLPEADLVPDVIPPTAVSFPNAPNQAIGQRYAFTKEPQLIGSSSCWLHGGTHSIGANIPLIMVGSYVLPGGTQADLNFSGFTFPNDILTALVEFGDTPNTGFTTQQLCIVLASSTTAKLRIKIGNFSGANYRINTTVIGW